MAVSSRQKVSIGLIALAIVLAAMGAARVIGSRLDLGQMNFTAIGYHSSVGSNWTMRANYTTGRYNKTYRPQEGQSLHITVHVGEGELSMTLTQGELTRTHSLTEVEGELVLDLSEFAAGEKVRATLTCEKARDVNFKATLE